MKIRIKGNSLRYRLTRSEVELFKLTGRVEEITSFGNSSLSYSLIQSEEKELSASFSDNKIVVHVPVNITLEWTNTELVGFSSNNTVPSLLIEKDFTCLDTVDEDQSDNYPNPLAAKN